MAKQKEGGDICQIHRQSSSAMENLILALALALVALSFAPAHARIQTMDFAGVEPPASSSATPEGYSSPSENPPTSGGCSPVSPIAPAPAPAEGGYSSIFSAPAPAPTAEDDSSEHGEEHHKKSTSSRFKAFFSLNYEHHSKKGKEKNLEASDSLPSAEASDSFPSSHGYASFPSTHSDSIPTFPESGAETDSEERD